VFPLVLASAGISNVDGISTRWYINKICFLICDSASEPSNMKIAMSCQQSPCSLVYIFDKYIFYRCYILIFPPYSFFSREKWVYTQFPPPGKMSIYWDFPPEKWVYTEFSHRKSKYVLTHTHFSPHTSFSPLLF
jgi:hypothetical protein